MPAIRRTVAALGAGALLALASAGPAAAAGARTSAAANQPPVATPDVRGVVAGGSVTVTLEGTDPDGDALIFAIATPPARGTLSGTPPDVVYTPASDFHGRDRFTFTVSDGRATSAPAPVTVLVSKRMENLGTLSGRSAALGIGGGGHVVGWAEPPAGTGGAHAVVWDPRGGLRDIAVFAGGSSFAFDVDDDGQVVGGAEHPDWSLHGFVWNAASGALDTGFAVPQAVTAAGRIAGQTADQGAFVGDTAGTVTSLPTLGGRTAFAMSLNRAGEVVGASETMDGDVHAVLWDATGGVQDLGTLPGGTYSVAHRINAAGVVVGESNRGDGDVRGFVWDVTTGMRELPGLPGGGYSVAYGLNDAGQIVGEALAASGQTRAVLWDSTGAIADLGDLGGGASTASAVNVLGQVVGQSALPSGDMRAVMWEPPLVVATPAGRAVATAFRGGAAAPTGATLTFASVVTPGDSALTTSTLGPDAPSGFTVASPATYFDFATSAGTTGAIDVCVSSLGRPAPGPGDLRLLQFEGGWADVTVSADAATGVVCGRVARLATFIIGARPRGGVLAATLEARPDRWSLRHAARERTTFIVGNVAGHDAREIDPASLRVNGVVPIAERHGELLARVVRHRRAFVGAALRVRVDLGAVLATAGPLRVGERITVTLEGRLRDGTPFTARDEVLIDRR